MSKRARDNCPFVDLEARVGDSESDEDEEEEDEEGQTFFVEPTQEHQLHTPWRDFTDLDKNSSQGGWSNLVSSLEERFASGSERIHGTAEHRNDHLAYEPVIAAAIDSATRLPTEDDYPLWRIRCKAGLEEEIVFFLLQMVYPRHEIRSAFAIGSARGWVYVEATMNDHLRRLLRLSPGILCDRCGICSQQVPFNEGLELLKMRSLNPPELGKWVQVLRGTYKGDIGYVLSVADSEVHLLLIPRIAPKLKRQRSRTRTTPKLFNHETHKLHYNIEPCCIHENIYSVGNDRFEHGLIVRSYRFDAVSTGVSTIPLESFKLFYESGHPKLTSSKSVFPRPSEWYFLEGDEVYNMDDPIPSRWWEPPSYKSGLISKLRDDAAELTTKEGTVIVPWMAICRVLRIGDFVEVMGGLHKEQKGWVDNVDLRNGGVANIIRMVDERKPFSGHAVETFQVNLNLLNHSNVPTLLGQHLKHADATPRSERVPWIDVNIIIADGMMKGRPGVIRDVLCNQRTPSGLKVVVQITLLDPAAPFRVITLDYDHVVEASRGVKLHHFWHPRTELFMPRNDEPPKLSHIVIPRPPSPLVISGSTTPLPESCLSSSPAWDPSSRTPQPDRTSPTPSQSVDPEHPPNPCTSLTSPVHALLNPRLVGVGIKVIVKGGGYEAKEISAFIVSTEGRLSIRRPKYKTSEYLSPDWVTPKYPNAKRENGLLIVIKGEHFGQYARRIYHRFVGDPQEPIAILAVVNRVAGQVDTITGDRLEMDASYLCVCEESIEDRKRNDLIMQPLREEARKKRAK